MPRTPEMGTGDVCPEVQDSAQPDPNVIQGIPKHIAMELMLDPFFIEEGRLDAIRDRTEAATLAGGAATRGSVLLAVY